MCTTFESPGLPDKYLDQARKVQPCTAYWRGVMQHYVGAPSPLNMVWGRLGRITHLIIPPGVSHKQPGWSSSQKRVAASAGALAALLSSLRSGSSGGGSSTASPAAAKLLQSMYAWRDKACGLVSSLLASAGVPLADSSEPDAAVAAGGGAKTAELMQLLSTCVCEVLHQHRLASMVRCFDVACPAAPLSHLSHEMASWPVLPDELPAMVQMLKALAMWVPVKGRQRVGLRLLLHDSDGEALISDCAGIEGYVPRCRAASQA